MPKAVDEVFICSRFDGQSLRESNECQQPNPVVPEWEPPDPRTRPLTRVPGPRTESASSWTRPPFDDFVVMPVGVRPPPGIATEPDVRRQALNRYSRSLPAFLVPSIVVPGCV